MFLERSSLFLHSRLIGWRKSLGAAQRAVECVCCDSAHSCGGCPDEIVGKFSATDFIAAQSFDDGCSILKRKRLRVDQASDCVGKLRSRNSVEGTEHPLDFAQDDVRQQHRVGTRHRLIDKRLRLLRLVPVVIQQQAQQNIGVEGNQRAYFFAAR